MSVVRRASSTICYHSRGYSFDPIFIKLAQDVYLDESTDPIENGCGQVKK